MPGKANVKHFALTDDLTQGWKESSHDRVLVVAKIRRIV